MLLARSDARAAELRRGYPGATTLVADLADAAGLERALAGALPDRLDSLVHAAGVVDLGPVAELAAGGVARAARRQPDGARLLTRRAAAGPARGARDGRLRELRCRPAPPTRVGGVRRLEARAAGARRRAARRGAGDGVRVTTVFPGRTATPMQEKVHEQEGREYDAGAWIGPETVADADPPRARPAARRDRARGAALPDARQRLRPRREAQERERQFRAPTSSIRSCTRAVSAIRFSATSSRRRDRPARP